MSQPGCRKEVDVASWMTTAIGRLRLGAKLGSTISRGFTLLEIAVVLAIIAIVSAIGLGALSLVQKRADYSGTMGYLVGSLRRTRSEAFGRGINTAFVVDTAGGQWWGVEAPTGWSLNSFNPSSPGTVIASGSLPTGMRFGPTAGYGVALPDPFSGIPTLSTQTPTPNYNYCSFCNTSAPNTGFGAILFDATGGASFLAGHTSAVAGEQFTVQGTYGNLVRTSAVAVVGRTGVVESFEQ
jgi:prepilin-type N-terminal cleavage/methylation domain-containing protein